MENYFIQIHFLSYTEEDSLLGKWIPFTLNLDHDFNKYGKKTRNTIGQGPEQDVHFYLIIWYVAKKLTL